MAAWSHHHARQKGSAHHTPPPGACVSDFPTRPHAAGSLLLKRAITGPTQHSGRGQYAGQSRHEDTCARPLTSRIVLLVTELGMEVVHWRPQICVQLADLKCGRLQGLEVRVHELHADLRQRDVVGQEPRPIDVAVARQPRAASQQRCGECGCMHVALLTAPHVHVKPIAFLEQSVLRQRQLDVQECLAVVLFFVVEVVVIRAVIARLRALPFLLTPRRRRLRWSYHPRTQAIQAAALVASA